MKVEINHKGYTITQLIINRNLFFTIRSAFFIQIKRKKKFSSKQTIWIIYIKFWLMWLFVQQKNLKK